MASRGWCLLSTICAISAVSAAGCAGYFKPREPDRRLDLHVAGTMFESSNGYRFAALPEPNAAIARLAVRYPIGAADDPPGKPGLAHLVEHLMFDVELTGPGGKTSISAELNRLAVAWNAQTTEDYTEYETYAPRAMVPALMALETARVTLGCAGLTPQIFEREREVVANEIRQRLGATGGSLRKLVLDDVYPVGHPYRALHSVEAVERLTLADACGFMAVQYRRGKATVVATGDVDAGELRAAAAATFGQLRPRDVAPRRPPAAAPVQPGIARTTGPVERTTLVVTWPMPDRASREARLLALVWPVLASEVEGPAFEFGWGHSASVNELGGDRAPVLALSIELASPDKVGDALAAVHRAVDLAIYRLGTAKTDGEWQRTWERGAEDALASWDTLSGRGDRFAELVENGGDGSQTIVGIVDELHAASPGDVRDLAHRWLDTSRARSLLITPSGEIPPMRGGRAVAGGEEQPAVVDLSRADQPIAVPPLRPAPATIRYTLGTGERVILAPTETSPLVYGANVLDVGAALEPPGEDGLTTLIAPGEASVDEIVSATRALSNRVDFLVEDLRHLRWHGQLSDQLKRYLGARLREERASERSDYLRELMTDVYGPGHPYARGGLTETSLAALHTDALNAWAETYMVPRNATVVIAGRFDPGLVRKYITYVLDHGASGERAGLPRATPTPHAAWVAGHTVRPSPTVELDVVFAGASGMRDEVAYAARVVLAQTIENRLEELRGKDAVTYGFSALYEPRLAGGLWSLTGEVDAARSGEAASAVAQILAEMRNDPASYRAAFVRARQRVLEGYLDRGTSAAAVMQRLAQLASFDLPDDYDDRLVRAIARVMPADVAALLAGELAADKQVFGAFGNAGPVRAALDAASAPPAPPAPPAPQPAVAPSAPSPDATPEPEPSPAPAPAPAPAP